jgi:hypothetical protein
VNPYSDHYSRTFAFDFILYPPENSVFVTLDLLVGSIQLDSVGLTLLRRLVFCSWLGAVFPAVGVAFTRTHEIQA